MSLRRNIAFSLLGQTGALLLSLAATRLVFKGLGADVLGIISFAVTATSLLIFLADVGITPAVTREVAVHGKRDPQYVQKLLRTASFLGWGGFFIMAVLAWLAAPAAVEHWLRLESTQTASEIQALRLISIALLLAFPRAVYGALINGYHRVDWSNMANLWASGIQQLGLIAVLAVAGSLGGVANWYVLSAFLGFLPFVLLAAKLAGWNALIPALHGDVVRRNAGFSRGLFANSVAGYAVTQVDRWTVSRLLPVSWLGFYGFVQGLASKGAIVPGAIANAAFPALSQSVMEGSRDAWLAQARKLQDACGYIYVPTTAAVAMLGIVVTRFVFDETVVAVLWMPLLLLACGQMMSGMLTVPYWLAMAQRRPDLAFRSNVFALAIVVPLAVWLTVRFGLVGAAASSIVYSAWQWAYFLPKVCHVCLSEPSTVWYKRILALPVLGLITYGVAWGVAWALGVGLSTMGVTSAFLVGSVGFMLIGWRVVGHETRLVFSQITEKYLGIRFGRSSNA